MLGNPYTKQLCASTLKKESVQTVAEACAIPAIECSAADILACDAEFRLRMLIQEAKKFSVHSKRWRTTPSGSGFLLSASDIQSALAVLHEDPIFGHNPAQGPEPAFLKTSVSGQEGSMFYTEDVTLPLSEVLNEPMPPCPRDVVLTQHWLAVEGVQPAIPQNPVPKKQTQQSSSPAAAAAPASRGSGAGGMPTEQRPRVAHVLSQEMQLFFKGIVDTLRAASEVVGTEQEVKKVHEEFDTTLRAVKSDPSVAQLLPYIVQFIADEVTHNLRNLELLTNVMALADALVDTRTLFLAPYLHQLLPAVLTCVVGKQLCTDRSVDDHWSLRDKAAAIVAKICRNFSGNQQSLEGRVVRTLFHALLDPEKPSCTHYGAIVCLGRLGDRVLELLIRNMRLFYTSILSSRIASQDELEKKEALRVNKSLFDLVRFYVFHATNINEKMMTSTSREDMMKVLWNPDNPQGRQLIRNLRSLYKVWADPILDLIKEKPSNIRELIASPVLEGFDDDDDDDEEYDDDDDDDEEAEAQGQPAASASAAQQQSDETEMV